MTTALFVGRFQPLHKGHAYALKHLLKRNKLIIAIGSTNKTGTENPFTFQERKSMLDAVLRKKKNRCRIIGAADYKSDRKWSSAIERRAKFDFIVTGNPWVKRCFRSYKSVKPRLLKQNVYNASRIRVLIRKNKNWQTYVPKEIITIVEKHFSRQ